MATQATALAGGLVGIGAAFAALKIGAAAWKVGSGVLDVACGVFLFVVSFVPGWDYNHPVNIVAVKFLRAFWEKYPDAEQPLKSWVDEAKKAAWAQPAEIKEQYRSASILKNRRVVFNIKGNDFRLVIAVRYTQGLMFVRYVGTHAELMALNGYYARLHSMGLDAPQTSGDIA